MCQFVWMFATYVQVHVEARGGRQSPPKAGVTGGCEPNDLGPGNRNQILLKNSWAIAPAA